MNTTQKFAATAIGSVSAAALAGGLLLPGVAWADTKLDPPKAVVCKYVGKPGVDERLQTGNNPIVVDRKDGMVIGSPFADAQGRSVVIAWAYPGEPQDMYTIKDCATPPTTPPPTTPPTTKPPTTKPPTTPPTTKPPKTSTPAKTTAPATSTTSSTSTAVNRGVPAKTGAAEDGLNPVTLAGLLGVLASGGALALGRRRGE